MYSRRYLLHYGAGSLIQLWSPSLFAASDVLYIIYSRGKQLDDILEYRDTLIERLPEKTAHKLQIVFTAQDTYGLVLPVTGKNKSARAQRYLKSHQRVFEEKFEIISSVEPSAHLLYGTFKNILVAHRAFKKAAAKLSSDLSKDLVLERSDSGELQLILKKYISIASAKKLAASAKTKISTQPPAITFDQMQLVEYDLAALELEQMLPKSQIPSRPPQVSKPNLSDVQRIIPQGILPASRIAPSLSPRPYPRLVPHNRTHLRNRVNALVQKLRKSHAVAKDESTSWYVYTLHDDRTWVSINGGHSRQTASMIKPFVGLAYFDHIREKGLRHSEEAQSHLLYMIAYSSNSATNWFIRKLGGPQAVNRLLTSKYKDIFRETSIVETIPQNGRTYRNRASAMDYVRFCRALWHNELPGSPELLRAMGLSRSNRLLRHADSIPNQTHLMNKTGSTARLIGDFGILVAKNTRGRRVPYVMVGVIEKKDRVGETQAYRNWLKARATVIGQASNVVYSYLKGKYRLT